MSDDVVLTAGIVLISHVRVLAFYIARFSTPERRDTLEFVLSDMARLCMPTFRDKEGSHHAGVDEILGALIRVF